MSSGLLAVTVTDRHQRAREIYEASERLAAAPIVAPREAGLTRLDLYRQATYWGLLAADPALAEGEWQALLARAPWLNQRTAELLGAPKESDLALDDAA